MILHKNVYTFLQKMRNGLICPSLHSQKKGTKAVTRAVPFQKGKLLSILGTNMYILGNKYILGANMDI